jgi:predicted cupin superfamily sugar epimerase
MCVSDDVMLTADEIKCVLDLRSLPEEGGYYVETYRVGEATNDDGATRPRATAIYYLLTPDTFSAMHRLPADEIFHWYGGDPVEQLHLFADGTGEVVSIGLDLCADMEPQVLVPTGVWQGARIQAGGTHGYALMGTTMAPGFDFADYEGGERDELTAEYPAFKDLIAALTR